MGLAIEKLYRKGRGFVKDDITGRAELCEGGGRSIDRAKIAPGDAWGGISLDKQVTAATLPSAFSSPSISLSLTSGWLWGSLSIKN